MPARRAGRLVEKAGGGSPFAALLGGALALRLIPSLLKQKQKEVGRRGETESSLWTSGWGGRGGAVTCWG